jgi:hypothetical protein
MITQYLNSPLDVFEKIFDSLKCMSSSFNLYYKNNVQNYLHSGFLAGLFLVHDALLVHVNNFRYAETRHLAMPCDWLMRLNFARIRKRKKSRCPYFSILRG